MINNELKLNKLLFTHDELKTIEDLINSGQSKHIMSALINLDPEKEAELQRVMNILNPIDDGFESEVRKKMNKKLPNGPQTPEEEAHWNRLLQEEYQTWLDGQKEKREEIESSLNKKDKDEVTITNDKNVSPEASSGHKIDDLMTLFKEKKELYKKIKDDPKKKKELTNLKKEILALKEELDSNK